MSVSAIPGHVGSRPHHNRISPSIDLPSTHSPIRPPTTGHLARTICEVSKAVISGNITLKSSGEVDAMRAAGRLCGQALDAVRKAIRPGISTFELDAIAEAVIRDAGGLPTFKGYFGFPATLCTSLNEEIVHGIPSKKRVLRLGDVIKIDCGATLDGWIGDAAFTAQVGGATGKPKKLMDATAAALEAGIKAMQPGGFLGDVCHAVEVVGKGQKYGIVTRYCGHGVGRRLHEEPSVPNVGVPGTGVPLVTGLVIAIEPMFTLGRADTVELKDGWTVKTRDGSLAAHFEHTVAMTDDGPSILTLP